MILRSLTVEGWKCFAEAVTVGPFADRLNVLFGPNGSGKSTLFEALRRALLDNHRTTAADLDKVRPWGRDLAPKVTVEFAQAGVEYRLEKRFLKGASSRLLQMEDGRFRPVAEDEAADERVRAVLRGTVPGRGLVKTEHWGLAQVLWAPQGDLALPSLSSDLVTLIRQSLGAQVTDEGAVPVQRRLQQLFGSLYTPTGALRSGQNSPLVVQLKKRLEATRGEATTLAGKLHEYEDRSREVEDLRKARQAALYEAQELSRRLVAVRGLAQRYGTLQAEAKQREQEVELAAGRLQAAKRIIEELAKSRKELTETKQGLERSTNEAETAARATNLARRAEELARAEVDAIRKRRDDVNAAAQLAQDAARYLDAKRQREAAETLLRSVGEVQAILADLRKQRGGVVAPDAKTLKKLRKSLQERESARLTLDAALITLEIVPLAEGVLEAVVAEQPGSVELRPGEPVTVKGAPEVAVEWTGVGRVRARGPAGTADDLRAALAKAEEAIRSLTLPFATDDLEELEARHTRALDLDKQIDENEVRLATLLGDRKLEEIEQEQTAARETIEAILKRQPAWEAEPPDAVALRGQADEQRREFEALIDVAEAKRDATGKALATALEAQAKAEAGRTETEKRVPSLTARVAELEGEGRTDAEREAQRDRLALAWDAAVAAQRKVAADLAEFGQDPGIEVGQLERQLAAGEEAARENIARENRAQGALQQLADAAPYSVLAEKEEEVARLEGEHGREDVRTRAVKLLHEVFDDVRREAVAQVVGPVEKRATQTLQRIAGNRFDTVHLDESFAAPAVSPHSVETHVGASDVSGGEAEQLNLAVRLALAEELARDERQLVVLDDALVFTDVGRLSRVLTILEEAAERLQVLILTCHPERYRGMQGATFIDLEAYRV